MQTEHPEGVRVGTDLADIVELDQSEIGNVNGIDDNHLKDTTQACSTIYDINNCVVDIPG